MSPSPVYQAALSELESVLPPRVVSRSLKEGLAQIASTPERLDLPGLERILKGPVYRHLQAAMPAEQAKETISQILTRLGDLEGRPASSKNPTPAPLERQQATLEELKEAMRPFNLYFEWPEVQKLRAQIQLLESETEAGNESAGLVRETREQLRTVSQKLEDLLVIQARDLGELDGLLEQVKSLGGTKVRRLENLLGQVRDAQAGRQLATAEVERARKLGAELRKLLESSVLVAEERPAVDDSGIIDVEGDDEESLTVVQDDYDEGVSARLLQIDVESERRELSALEAGNAHLLEYRPRLRDTFAELRGKLDSGEPAGERLAALREELEKDSEELRSSLAEELGQLGEECHLLRQHADVAELSQALQVARGVLESTLPPANDVSRIRELADLARRRAGEAQQLEEAAEDERLDRLREQGATLARLEESAGQFDEGTTPAEQLEEFRGGLAALRAAHQQQELVPELLAAVLRSEERLRRALGSSVGSPASSATADPALLRSYEQRLAAASREAAFLGVRSISERIATAREELAQGVLPGLHEIETGLRAVADRRRQEELEELRALEIEVRRFAGADVLGYQQLQELLARAHAAEGAGERDELLGQAWLQLEALRATVEQRLAGLEGRLDKGLAVLARVEKLNSEDVEEARRILQHLDGQRDALGRVSLGLRLELESSLQHAETLLQKLEQEYEATRAIADQLVSGNFIDDMLGLLGSDEPRRESAGRQLELPQPDVPGEPIVARSENPKLNAWVDRYLAEPGVREAALLDRSGRMIAGSMQLDPGRARVAVDDWAKGLANLGRELSAGGPVLATLEVGAQAVVVSREIGEYRLVAVLDSAAGLTRVLYRLRRELSRSGTKTASGSTLA